MVATQPSRRTMLGAALVSPFLIAATGCTAGSGPSGQGTGSGATPPVTDTIRMPFSFSMQQPDPDVFFQAEGLNVTTGVYEGLLRHVPNAETPEIEPWLAESYAVSEDAMTYTFVLREGVVFHDGTPMDAEAVKFSFERRRDVGAGPSQSLYAFDAAEVIDPLTVAIRLSQPSTEFVPFLASAYGQKIVSPTAVREHEVDGDLAQGWLSSNSAGTGAYKIDDFTAQRYLLTEHTEYWGDAPGFANVEITIEPNFTSQVLRLRAGEFDVITHGVPTADIASLESDGFTITRAATFNRATLFLNPAHPALADAEARRAVAAAIDRETLVDQVFGDLADVAEQMTPAGLLPEGTGLFTAEFDTAVAQAHVDDLPADARELDMAYLADDPDNQQIAQIIQAHLQAVGLAVTTRSIPQTESFEFPTNPGARPDILLVGGKASDAAHPDPFLRLFYFQDGPLSYFQPDQAAEADALANEARLQADLDTALQMYGQAAELYDASGLFIPLTDRPEVIVTRPGIAGIEHEFNAVSSIRLASLRPE